eukprot:110616_1
MVYDKGKGNWKYVGVLKPESHFIHPWGWGWSHIDKIVDGIFIAVSVNDNCVAWNCRIMPDIFGREAIGPFGDVNHLKPYMSEADEKKIEEQKEHWAISSFSDDISKEYSNNFSV